MSDPVLETAESRDAKVAWSPSPDYIERSRLKQFIERRGFSTLDELQTWSEQDPGNYWDAAVQELGITFSTPYMQSLDLTNGIPWAKWFEGGKFNYVTSALDRWIEAGRGDDTALIWEGDDGATVRWSFAELAAETNRVGNALTELGIARGDRVGIFLPMLPETVAAVLACGRIGAIYSPMFSSVTKRAPMYGQGEQLGPNRFETTKGVGIYFYEPDAIHAEFDTIGLLDFTEITEPNHGRGINFWLIQCHKPE